MKSSSSSSLCSSVVVRRSVRSIKQEARARARALHAAAHQLSQSNAFLQVIDMNTHLSVQLPIGDRDRDRVPVPVHSQSPQCPSALPSDAVHVDERDSNKETGAMEEAKVEEAIEKASVGCASAEMNLNLPPAECDEGEEVEVEIEVEDKENKA